MFIYGFKDCNYTFDRESRHFAHVNRHTNIKPCSCSVCAKKKFVDGKFKKTYTKNYEYVYLTNYLSALNHSNHQGHYQFTENQHKTLSSFAIMGKL